MKKTCKTCGETKPVSEFTWRKDSNKYYSGCKECRNRRYREKRKADKEIAGTQRIIIPNPSGYERGTEACDRCQKGVRLMCDDRVIAGRAVLCEVQSEEERQRDYCAN